MPLKVRRRVAVACVTFETAKVVKPILSIGGVDRAYLLHYERPDPSKKRHIYQEFYDEVARQLREGQPGIGIADENIPVYNFKEMLAALIRILHEESSAGNEVFVNLSAGTAEYIAAATIASMMMEGITPFTVSTKEWKIPPEELPDVYYDGDRPVGMARDVNEPQPFPTFHIARPPDDLVRGLKVLREKFEKAHRTTYVAMIKGLKDAGCWEREEPEREKDREQAEKMYYLRHFIKGWEQRGWVKADARGKYRLTDDGMTVTEVF